MGKIFVGRPFFFPRTRQGAGAPVSVGFEPGRARVGGINGVVGSGNGILVEQHGQVLRFRLQEILNDEEKKEGEKGRKKEGRKEERTKERKKSEKKPC